MVKMMSKMQRFLLKPYCNFDFNYGLLVSQILVEHCAADDPDTEINLGCLQYKEGDYDGALKRFVAAQQVVGYKPDLAYNIALCHYEMKQYSQALKFTAEIIEKGVKDHPGVIILLHIS